MTSVLTQPDSMPSSRQSFHRRGNSTLSLVKPALISYKNPSSPTLTNRSRSKSVGNAAAVELWDLIHSTPGPTVISSVPSVVLEDSITVPRYAEAQRNRTIWHPMLIQPSPAEETRHLEKVEQAPSYLEWNATNCSNIITSNESLNRESDLEAGKLKARLSAALLGAAMHYSFSRDQTTEDRNYDKYDIGMDIDGDDGNGPSPTSTLHLPSDSSMQKLNWSRHSHNNDLSVSFQAPSVSLEYCTFIDQKSIQVETKRYTEMDRHSPSHTFVVVADSQLGMTTLNQDWTAELEFCRQAVNSINALRPRPKFVCVCGDLVDMEYTFYANNPKALKPYSRNDCDSIQDSQNADFKKVWSHIHPDIALVCLCGNHDIGNRPTPESIARFTNEYGDEYLAFWTNGTYNIVLNNVLFTNSNGAQKIFDDQLAWLEDRLQYAQKHNSAQTFVFAHHPWFLYHEDEDENFLHGGSPFPKEWDDGTGRFDGVVFPDSYFSVPKQYRKIALNLFQKYNVHACFSGHFHQNLLAKAMWGMDMIITAPLSMVFSSTGKPEQPEVNCRGIRVVGVQVDTEGNEERGAGRFKHWFQSL